MGWIALILAVGLLGHNMDRDIREAIPAREMPSRGWRFAGRWMVGMVIYGLPCAVLVWALRWIFSA